MRPIMMIAAEALLYGDDSSMSFRMRMGVNDGEPRAWDGSLSVAGGTVTRIRNWRPRAGDRIDGNRGWSLSGRKGLNFDRRSWEEEIPGGVVPYINAPGIIVDLKTTGTSSVWVWVKQGSFVVSSRILETASGV